VVLRGVEIAHEAGRFGGELKIDLNGVRPRPKVYAFHGGKWKRVASARAGFVKVLVWGMPRAVPVEDIEEIRVVFKKRDGDGSKNCNPDSD